MSPDESQEIEYGVDDKRYVGTLLRHSTKTPRMLAILLPDWRGRSPLAKDHASHLVSLGCTVLIADLYGDGFNPDSPDQVGPMVKHLIEHRNQGVEALDAAIKRAREEVPAETPVICIGYSAGGMIALDYGRSGAPVSGIILCTALLKTAAEGMATRIDAPVLILQGTQDQVSPMEVIADVIAEMDSAKNDVRFELYSQTHHAFDNPEAGDDPAARLVYSRRSAQRSMQSISNFISEICGA